MRPEPRADAAPQRASGPPGLGARFRIRECLGRGSMGVVYAALDEELGHEVALKTLDNVSAEGFFQLKQEFRIVRGIDHRNLVRLYELFTSPEGGWFTMELVRGEDLLRCAGWTGGAGPLPPERLRRIGDLFLQLTSGIEALHDSGKLHRDIKPSNILVERDGRLVILDFGLATHREPGPFDVGDEVAGSPAYMAPEALWGAAPRPAVDWYSVGVVLFEVLTGASPFAEARLDFVRTKGRPLATPPGARVPGIPETLDALVSALMHPDPARRPGAAEIRGALARSTGAGAPPSVTSARPHAARTPFVGRHAEIDKLAALHRSACSGAAAVAYVSGPSGIGKSELARTFLASVEQRAQALVLRARCHPLESVAFRALDGIIDDLTRHLVRLDEVAQRRLVPEHTDALIQLFPVLERVPAFAAAPRDASAVEPHEIRQQGALALRELIGALARERPVILAIDDVHWGDADSVLLLQALLQPLETPGLMLLLVYRDDEMERRPVLQRFAALGAPESAAVARIELPPLAEADARELAHTLVPAGSPAREAIVRAIAVESGGFPLFAGELARAVGGRPLAADEPPRLGIEAVIIERVDRLSEPRRRLLELVSIAGGPIDQRLALGAAGLGEAGRPLLYPLIEDCLLRDTTISDVPAIAPYHDRIREAVIAALPAAERRSYHRRIADAVRGSQRPDPLMLTEHYMQAGEEELAATFAVEAGQAAARTLAFDRAADLYRIAVRLRGAAASWSLHAELAEALANAGRGIEAGQSYAEAARILAASQPGALEILALRRRAAENFLRSGELAEGRRVMRDVLDEFHIDVPRTPEASLRAALFSRGRLLVRGLGFRRREAPEIPPEVLARLDAIWGAGTSVTMVDYVPADALSMIHLFGALDAGEPSRVLRALGWEAAFEAQIGGTFFQGRADRLLHMSARLAESTGLDYDRAWVLACRSTVHWQRCAWSALVDASSQAIDIFRDRCRGADWEIAVTQVYLLAGLANRGAIRRLVHLTRAGLDRAAARGDRFATNVYVLGLPSLAWLAQDQPDVALAQADEAIQRWSTDGFNLQHYHHLLASTQALLYRGDVWPAWRRLTAGWPAFAKSAYLSVANIRCEMAHLRGRAALAALAAGTPPSDLRAWSPRKLEREIDDAIRNVRRTGLPIATPLADALEAGRCEHREDASMYWERAWRGFVRAEMMLYARAAERRLGEAAGRAEWVRESEAAMREEGIVCPEAMARLITPHGGCRSQEP